MYVISGATGHIGGRISEILLGKGKDVRVIGRAPERLRVLVNKGATPCVGSLDNTTFLGEAFAGADAVFTMIPPNMQAEDFGAFQKHVSEAIVKALKSAHVKHVVNLSSLGANLGHGNGPIAGLHDHEERLAKTKVKTVINLRPGFFMENLLQNLPLIKAQGINGMPLRGDMPIPMIATRDIAEAVVEGLLAPNPAGNIVRELLGQRDISMNEATQILGNAMGKPDLKYVQFPYDSAREAMIKMGLSVSISDLFIDMYRAFNDGKIMRGFVRTAENTTATSFEQFVQQVALPC
jgi:uncharacterized protein YbjT (DUF2867 family)